MSRLDRWLGGILVLTGLAIVGAARGYTVGFMVDPLGPRALPYLVAALLVPSGSALLLGKRKDEAEGEGELRAPSLLPQVATTVVLLLFAALIPLLGFIPPSVMATGALAKLFGGRWVPGLAVGLVLSLGLYALFALGFGLDLPMGMIFTGAP